MATTLNPAARASRRPPVAARRLGPYLILLAWVCTPLAARAGGGPENVLLVANPNSADSLEIANLYVALRKIPAANVFYLKWDPAKETTDIATFRQKILRPILKAIQTRRLSPQIDYVVYSSGYPHRIDYKNELAEDSKVDHTARRHPSASLTGLTYLAALVLSEKPIYTGLRSNWYAPRIGADHAPPASRAFRASSLWGPDGSRVDEKGIRYLLSTMLGYTAGRGNSVEEVKAYLRASAAADGGQPKGTIYFVKNGNIRSRARQAAFEPAVKTLRELGVKAEVLEGVLPANRHNVAGAMIGAAQFASTSLALAACCERRRVKRR